VTLSSPRSWLRSRLEVLLGHVFYGKRKQDRCSIYHNKLGIGTVRFVSLFYLTPLLTHAIKYLEVHSCPIYRLKISGDSLHPSPSFSTVLESGVECRVLSLVLVRVESGTAVFIQTRLLTDHWAYNTLYYTQLLGILSSHLLKHTLAYRTVTIACSITSTCSFTQHPHHPWQSSQCTTYLKL